MNNFQYSFVKHLHHFLYFSLVKVLPGNISLRQVFLHFFESIQRNLKYEHKHQEIFHNLFQNLLLQPTYFCILKDRHYRLDMHLFPIKYTGLFIQTNCVKAIVEHSPSLFFLGVERHIKNVCIKSQKSRNQSL